MSKKKFKDKKIQKTIALHRIRKLFLLAEQQAHLDRLNLANRYVELARNISMRCLVGIPKEYKHRFCKHCYQYLLPDVTCRIRIHRGRLVIYCHNCKKYARIPLKKSVLGSARLK